MRRPRRLLLLLALSACTAAPPAPRGVTVALVQYQVRGDQPVAELLAEVAVQARAAAARGARLCLFPELVAIDCWPLGTTAAGEAAAAEALADTVTPALVRHCQSLGRELDLAILVGGPRRHGEALRNTAFLCLPDGSVLQQDKLFLTAWERSVGWQPGDVLLVFDAPWGRSAILTCYDVEFPVVSQALAGHDVEVLLVPSMTESTHGLQRVRSCAGARAIEHHAFVLLAATVGQPLPDWRHFGQSAVLAPQEGPFEGLLAAAAPDRPELLVTVLDLERLRLSRAEAKFFPVRDQGMGLRGGPERRATIPVRALGPLPGFAARPVPPSRRRGRPRATS